MGYTQLIDESKTIQNGWQSRRNGDAIARGTPLMTMLLLQIMIILMAATTTMMMVIAEKHVTGPNAVYSLLVGRRSRY